MEKLKIEENSEIAIMIKRIKGEKIKESFIKVIKERILAKTELVKNEKGNGLKDKRLERMLGKMLIMQIGNEDKKTVNIDPNYKYDEDIMIKKIFEEQQKIEQGKKEGKVDEVAINTIIEMILLYGETQVKEVRKEFEAEDINKYKAMLCAA